MHRLELPVAQSISMDLGNGNSFSSAFSSAQAIAICLPQISGFADFGGK